MQNKTIQDYIPEEFMDVIRKHLKAGVSNAEATFEYHEADEDSITGALGQELITKQPMNFTDGVARYTFEVSSRKIRGRGKNAPEKLTGADGIFQISIKNSYNEIIFRKGLPFQSKKNWKNSNKDLLEQSKKMIEITKSGIIINYTKNGYEAYDAIDVIEASGKRKNLIENQKKYKLGKVLGENFLNCIIGKEGLFYDKDKEIFLFNVQEFTVIESKITIE